MNNVKEESVISLIKSFFISQPEEMTSEMFINKNEKISEDKKKILINALNKTDKVMNKLIPNSKKNLELKSSIDKNTKLKDEKENNEELKNKQKENLDIERID